MTEEFSVGATQLGQILNKASHNSCDIILVGGAVCKAVKAISDSSSQYTAFENEYNVWEFLKGGILPGIAALDKVSHALELLFLLLSPLVHSKFYQDKKLQHGSHCKHICVCLYNQYIMHDTNLATSPQHSMTKSVA